MKREGRIRFGLFIVGLVAATPLAWGAASGSARAGANVAASPLPSRPAACPGVPAAVPATGQTMCFDENGAGTPCHGTGQDGELEAGVVTHPRFTDRHDGTVKDNLTGLIWLKNAWCGGNLKWVDGLTFASFLAHGACGLTDGSLPGDWRVPNVRELQSLVDFGRSDPALPAGHPFTNVQLKDYQQDQEYWTSSTWLYQPSTAWSVRFHDGGSSWGGKSYWSYALWPVRNERSDARAAVDVRHVPCGNPANRDAVPAAVQKTGQTACYASNGNNIACGGTSQDGALQLGAAVDPRFTDNGDGSVTDNLTGLIWLKDAYGIGRYNLADALAAVSALASGESDLTDGSTAGDWRLPNVNEMQTLLDFGQFGPSLPVGHPFLQVWVQQFWTSTSYALSPSRSWFVDTATGYILPDDKYYEYYVWPVRNAGSR